MGSLDLEWKLKDTFRELKFSKKQQYVINTYLELLKLKHLDTWEHSVRVGLKAKELAKYLHTINLEEFSKYNLEKDFFQKDLTDNFFKYGLLHDVGKIGIDPNVLEKKGKNKFTKKDLERMKPHTILGYRMLRRKHDGASLIALWHHYEIKGYPKFNPPLRKRNPVHLCYAGIIGLIDFYEAAISRDDGEFKEKGALTPKEARQKLIEACPNKNILINDLYKVKIF